MYANWLFYLCIYVCIYRGGDKSIAHFYIYDIEKVFLLNQKEILFT